MNHSLQALIITLLTMVALIACSGEQPGETPGGILPTLEFTEEATPTGARPPGTKPAPAPTPGTTPAPTPGTTPTPTPGTTPTPAATPDSAEVKPTRTPEPEERMTGLAFGYGRKAPRHDLPLIELEIRRPRTLQVYAQYDDGSYGPLPDDGGKTLEVTSDQPEWVAVFRNNTLLAEFQGSAIITAAFGEFTAQAKAYAKGAPALDQENLYELEIFPRIINMETTGQPVQLQLKGTYANHPDFGPIPQDLEGRPVFRVEDPGIAQVTPDGLLTGLRRGETLVHAQLGEWDTGQGTEVIIRGSTGAEPRTELQQPPTETPGPRDPGPGFGRAGDHIVRIEASPERVTLAPGQSMRVESITAHLADGTKRNVNPDDPQVKYKSESLDPTQPTYLEQYGIKPTELSRELTIRGDSPTTSWNLRIEYLGHITGTTIDVRARPEPGRTNCAEDAGSAGMTLFEFGDDSTDEDQDRAAELMTGAVILRYSEFKAAVITHPCVSPEEDLSRAASAALASGARSAQPYWPTPGDREARITTALIDEARFRLTLIQGQRTRLTTTWGIDENRNRVRLSQAHLSQVTFRSHNTKVATLDPKTGELEALNQGKSLVTATYAARDYVELVILVQPEQDPSGVSGRPVRIYADPEGEPLIFHPGETPVIRVWAVYQNGARRQLKKGEAHLIFQDDGFLHEKMPVSEDGTVTVADEEVIESHLANKTITIIHGNLTLEKDIRLRDPYPPLPQVDQQCLRQDEAKGQRLRADTFAVNMESTARYGKNSLPQALGGTLAGTLRTTEGEYEYLVQFPCNTPEDLQEAYRITRRHEKVYSFRVFFPDWTDQAPSSAILTRANGREIREPGPFYLQVGRTETLGLKLTFPDGSARTATPEEAERMRIRVQDPAVAETEGSRITALEASETRVEIEYEGITKNLSVRGFPLTTDSQCRLWKSDGELDGESHFAGSDHTTVRLQLRKEPDQDAAREIAAAIGGILLDKTEGPEAILVYTIRMNLYCNAHDLAAHRRLYDVQSRVEAAQGDSRVFNIEFAPESVRLRADSGPGVPLEIRGWRTLESAADPRYNPQPDTSPVTGLTALTHRGESIHPLGKVTIHTGLLRQSGNTVQLTQEMKRSISYSSSTPDVVRVTKLDRPVWDQYLEREVRYRLTALNPGSAEVTVAAGGYQAKVQVNVLEPEATFPALAGSCRREVAGMTVVTNQAILRTKEGTSRDQVAAAASEAGAFLRHSSPDGRIHLLERGCHGEPPDQTRPDPALRLEAWTWDRQKNTDEAVHNEGGPGGLGLRYPQLGTVHIHITGE